MLDNRESKLRIYSLGIVVYDKPRDTKIIDVLPVEEISNIDGKLTDYKPKYNVQLPDVAKVNRKSKIEGQSYIEAHWLPLSQSNRHTAPDVIANETVLLYRYADSEKYYWDTLFIEPNIRRLETVLHMFGNLKAALTEWDKSSSYWSEVSTHDKHIHVKTTKSDGEPFEYDIKLDTGAGTFELFDDIGNLLKLYSNDHRWFIINATGSYFDIVEDVILGYAETLICLKSAKIHMNTGDFTVGAGICGVLTEHPNDGYRGKPFIHLCEESRHVQLGTGLDAFIEITGQSINTTAKGGVNTKIGGDGSTTITGNESKEIAGNSKSEIEGNVELIAGSEIKETSPSRIIRTDQYDILASESIREETIEKDVILDNLRFKSNKRIDVDCEIGIWIRNIIDAQKRQEYNPEDLDIHIEGNITIEPGYDIKIGSGPLTAQLATIVSEINTVKASVTSTQATLTQTQESVSTLETSSSSGISSLTTAILDTQTAITNLAMQVRVLETGLMELTARVASLETAAASSGGTTTP